MPLKRDLALQNIPLSKQPFTMQPQIANEGVTWNPQYNLTPTRTNKRRALSLQEVESDGWFLILHVTLETCIIQNPCTSSIWVLYFISIFWDWRRELEPTFQNETRMSASILNTAPPPTHFKHDNFDMTSMTSYLLFLLTYARLQHSFAHPSEIPTLVEQTRKPQFQPPAPPLLLISTLP